MHINRMLVGVGVLNFIHGTWTAICSYAPIFSLYLHREPIGYLPGSITMISYCLLNRRCALSIVENYFYPELYPNSEQLVSAWIIMYLMLSMLGNYWFHHDKRNSREVKIIIYTTVLMCVSLIGLI